MKYLYSLLFLVICSACAAQSPYFDALTLSKYAKVKTDGKLYLAIGNYQNPEQASNKAAEDLLQTQIMAASSDAIKAGLQAQAQKLKDADKAILQAQRNELYSVLKKYYPTLQPGETTFDTQNPFFIIDASGLQATTTASLINLSDAVSAAGGLDVTTIANGVAKFLIKRGKQELSIAFFQKFRTVIEHNADLKSLFPTTYPLLDAIDAEIYNYSAYIQNLREAFKGDITALPKNLPTLVTNHPDIFRKHPNLEVELVGACYLASELENHSHPGDIIANFPPDLLDKLDLAADSNSHYLKAGIQTLQLFSDALRNSADGDDSYWVNPDQLKTLVRDKNAFRIFLGLIDQNAKLYYDGIKFTKDGSKTFSGYLETAGSVANTNLPILDSYKTYLTTFTGQATELSKLIRDDQVSPTDSAAVEKYAIYFKAVVKLMEKASDAGNLQCLSGADPKPVTICHALGAQDFHILLKPHFDLSYNLADLITAISGKNYSAAVNQAVSVYRLILVNGSKDISVSINPKLQKDVDDALNNLSKATGKAIPATVKTEIINSALYANVNFNEFVKYTSFMAAVATAKTSDDVENAIEAAALPAGSYTIKQKSTFNISLNAYVGYSWDFTNINLFKPGNLYANGIYAPIGFSASLGGKKGHGAVTFFASLIDLGSLVSYNLGADSVKKLKQNIRLESIISPSLQLFYEIPGWPVAIGTGWRRTPKIFFSNDSGFKVVAPRGVINLSILIDIPLFTFYNRQRSQ